MSIGPIDGVEVHVALCYYPENVARYDSALYDTDTYPGPPPCTDVSCDVTSYASNNGRDLPLERFRTGTATIVLDDPTGKYSPWRTADSPGEFGTIRPGIDVEVWAEIGGPNVLRNSSFESPFSGSWGVPDVPAVTWAIDTADAYHAASSALMTCQDPTFNGNPGHWGNLIGVPDGSDAGYEGPWTASAWIKAPAGRSIGVAQIKYYSDGAGGSLAPWQPGYPADATLGGSEYAPILASGDWQRVTLTFPADTSAATSYGMDYRVGIGGGTTGWQIGDTLRADAAQLERGTVATPYAPRRGEYPRYPRFAGRVTAMKDLFDAKDPDHHAVQYDCADYLSLLAAYDGSEQSPIGAGETSGARIARILDTAGYDRPRALDAGAVALQPTTLAKNMLDEAGMVCDTELGALFCDPAGTLVHRDRNGLVSDPLYTDVQAVFGEVDPELCYEAIGLASDTDKIKNIVSIAPDGGTAVTVTDGLSASLYGPSTYRRFDLIHQDPAQSAVIAQRHLDFYAYAANRIENLTPVVNAETLLALLPLYLLWRIQVRRRAEGFQVVADLQIEAIREQITARAWTIELTTFNADAVFDVGRYDVDLYDSGLWGY